MRIAFKEWAIVVDALGRGEQILILRKGGINEGRGGFKPEQPRFLLFPTGFHQQRESVIDTAQKRYDEIAASVSGKEEVRIEYWAEVILALEIKSRDAAATLRGQHIWRHEVIAARFDWGRDKGIHALGVRVHRLRHPARLPLVESYGGCKSWIELEQEVETVDSSPVLPESAFARRADELRAALQRSVSTA